MIRGNCARIVFRCRIPDKKVLKYLKIKLFGLVPVVLWYGIYSKTNMVLIIVIGSGIRV